MHFFVAMTTLHSLIIFSLIISLTFTTTHFTSTIATVADTTKHKRLVTKLLHHDSLLQNPNDTIEIRAQRTLNTSIARFNYLSQKASKTTATAHDPEAQLHPGTSSLFYVSFSIGQPPVPQRAVMDSGSSIIWVQCQPCKKCNTQPNFDPSKSSTYANLPCDTSVCANNCSSFSDECLYKINYIRGPDSLLTIATEQFSFVTTDESEILVNDVAFGCSHNNTNYKEDRFNGVFGLGTKYPTLSLVQKFGSKFSYCIGKFNDPEYTYNMLILGEEAILEGDPTPVDVIDGFYYLTLEGISIGQKLLDIDPNTFKRSTIRGSSDDGVCIDSGTAFTWLAPSAFQALRQEIEDLSEGLLTRHKKEDPAAWLLCFSGNLSRDLDGFPVMAFHFAGGADLVMDAETMFYQDSESVFCLAVGPSDFNGERYKDLSIIGMIAQQNYNVAYDLVGNQLYFQRIDCQLLVD